MATPAGRSIALLRASGRRTSDSACIGWPTTATPSGGRSTSIEKMDATGRTVDGRKHTATLEHAVKFTGWPTSQAGDCGRGQDTHRRDCPNIPNSHPTTIAPLSGWPTSRAEDSESTGPHRGNPDSLTSAGRLAGWGTPNASTPGGTPEQALARKQGLACGQSVTTLDNQCRGRLVDASSRDWKDTAGWPRKHRIRRLPPDAARSVAATGATRGAWADAEWLYCRDQKFRPVEPGTFPLGHGLPARVGRLRGYGNAIVAQLAAEYIQAYEESRR